MCIRISTERPEALDKACFVPAGIEEYSLLQAVEVAVELSRSGNHGTPVPDYMEEKLSIDFFCFVDNREYGVKDTD